MATHLAICFLLTATFSTIFADNNIDNQRKRDDQQLECDCADVKCQIYFDVEECQQMGGKMVLRSYDHDKCQCCDHCVVLRGYGETCFSDEYDEKKGDFDTSNIKIKCIDGLECSSRAGFLCTGLKNPEWVQDRISRAAKLEQKLIQFKNRNKYKDLYSVHGTHIIPSASNLLNELVKENPKIFWMKKTKRIKTISQFFAAKKYQREKLIEKNLKDKNKEFKQPNYPKSIN